MPKDWGIKGSWETIDQVWKKSQEMWDSGVVDVEKGTLSIIDFRNQYVSYSSLRTGFTISMLVSFTRINAFRLNLTTLMAESIG
jgi:hypothetical protein